MSFEGYYQKLCPSGHYWDVDCYSVGEEPEKCPCCGQDEVWHNLVDTTNGSFEDDKRIDGYVDLKLVSERKCEHCGSLLEQIYEIPRRTHVQK